MAGAIIPSLATEWAALSDNPNVWRFTLRKGVVFHDGSDFTSEDVIFSLNRAMADGSEMKELLSSVKEVRAVDSHIVDVETNGAVETKELPFVVGVIGDYSGHKQDKEEVEDRTFYNLDKDNFDAVMKRVGPELNLKVDNVLADDDSQFEASLNFNSMKDFQPEAIINQVEPLKN